jgi:hypothetical protein
VEFGLNRGELILVAIIFGLIYLSSLLPRITAMLSARAGEAASKPNE